VTIDRGFEHQQNLKALRFGLVIVHFAKNKVEFYRPIFSLQSSRTCTDTSLREHLSTARPE
jgi:hypothetical protein